MNYSRKIKLLYGLICLLLFVSAGLVLFARASIKRLVGTSTDELPVYHYHFALVPDSYDNPYWNLVYDGARQEAEQNSAYLEVTGANLSEHYPLSGRLQMAVASQLDGIIVASDGSKEMDELITDATSGNYLKSVPVLTVMKDNAYESRTGFVGINSYEQGQEYGKLLVRLYRKKGIRSVTLLSDYVQKENDLFYGDIIYSSIQEYLRREDVADDISVSVEYINHASTFNCRRDILLLLNRENPPEVLIGTDYLYTVSACQILVDRNLVGNTWLLGSYLSDEILDYIQKGTMYATVASDPYKLGRTCIKTLIEFNESGRSNEYQNIDMMVITSDNVGEYQKHFQEVAS